MGSGAVTGPSHVAWEIDGQKLGMNAVALRPTQEESGKRLELLDYKRKRLFRKASGDPRVAGRYWDLEMNFSSVNHELVAWLEERMVMFRAPFPIKIGQMNYRNLGVGGADFYDAARLYPSTPGASTCALWFFPRRGISNDAGEGPFLYKNGTLVSSGISYDLGEGSVSFTTPPASSDVIRAYFVWKPKVLIRPEGTQFISRTGKIQGKELYEITLSLEQL